MNKSECDDESGVCAPAFSASSQASKNSPGTGIELIYAGDPMCSWCWGIAPALRQLHDYCQTRKLVFRVVVGGLRPGGGDPWNEPFRQFLKHHWKEVGSRTGQPFSFSLLDWPVFDYDTEPACRSVVAARSMLEGPELEFFYAVQSKFYVDNEDPKQPEFYRDLCARFDLDFDEFLQHFDSEETRTETRAEFRLCSSWGITGFPSILLKAPGSLSTVATGFSTFEKMQRRLESLLSASQ